MISREHAKTFEIDYPIRDVFPLFTPEGEKLWAPGWDYESPQGLTELAEDDIFLTQNHDHGASEAIWIVKEFDPTNHIVQYYKIEPGNKVGIITVKCTGLDPAKTSIEVTYKYVALSVTGEEFISEFTANVYDEFISEWQTLLVAYFQSKG